MMKPLETRAMNKYNWGGIEIYWVDTTELES